MADRGSVSLKKSKVCVSRDDVDVALDLLVRAVHDVEGQRRPAKDVAKVVD